MKAIKDIKYYEMLNKLRKDLINNLNLSFTGSSPPEIFIGEFNYPNVYTGILSPAVHNDSSSILSSPEEWFKARLTEKEILLNRASLIYSRFTSNIKQSSRLLSTMQEVSMAKKPVDIDFELKKKPSFAFKLDSFHKPIFNPAPLAKAVPEGNTQIEKRVDCMVSDYGMKANDAVIDLYTNGISISNINRILSAGLLGIKNKRKLVPTKWSITCVDDIISKNLIEKIKQYPWINNYFVFNSEYLGNHYEILLMPRQFGFEVIEAKYNPNPKLISFWQDSESHLGRKSYASSVTGAYYANRIAISSYLDSIRRQASILVLREVKNYEIPCGVGILREATKYAMNKNPSSFNNISSAFNDMKSRLSIPISMFLEKSILLREISSQKTLQQF
ncbi:hypothetical protein J4231_01480 [Candidatus Woesearchaeota archaeon]|nr:hypothetical protein [Candidatus Woesearchaeota archaeon]